jgi:hypothetical protein
VSVEVVAAAGVDAACGEAPAAGIGPAAATVPPLPMAGAAPAVPAAGLWFDTAEGVLAAPASPVAVLPGVGCDGAMLLLLLPSLPGAVSALYQIAQAFLMCASFLPLTSLTKYSCACTLDKNQWMELINRCCF